MSPLLDEARSVLSSFREHVQGWVNQGLLTTIDEHLARLKAAAALADADATAAVHKILTDLYTALHTPQPDAPAPAPAEDPVAEAPVDAEPVLAAGGTVAGPGVLIGESGSELLTIPDGAPVVPAPVDEPAAESAAVVAEPETEAAPVADPAAPTEN